MCKWLIDKLAHIIVYCIDAVKNFVICADTNDILFPVNASQAELQRCIGVPADSAKLEDLRKTLIARLDGFEKRLETIENVHIKFLIAHL